MMITTTLAIMQQSLQGVSRMGNEKVMAGIKRGFIHKSVASGNRQDGRGFEEYRPLSVEKNVISSANGSARLRLGDTEVLCGVKMEIGEPYSDAPGSGVLSTSAELSAVASPTFDAGPPKNDAIEIARVTDRAIRESKVIDLDSLCIVHGKRVWIVYIDIHVLDYNGNLFDACQMATLAALSCTMVPPARDSGSNEDEDAPQPLAINKKPISMTFAKIGEGIVVDPDLDEERVADCRMTVSMCEDGRIHALQKGLSGGMMAEEIKKIISIASGINPTLRRKVLEE
jgi:exosome complex component RRP42